MLRPFIFLFCATVASVVFGCENFKPVGLELGSNGPIPDESMTASSEYNKWHAAAQGRLNNYKGKPSITRGIGAWCANKTDNVQFRYLQIDLGSVRKIERIGTQGRNESRLARYVSKYTVSYSENGKFFPGIKIGITDKIFTGNTDRNSIVYNDLTSPNGEPLVARYIRIQPTEFLRNICMRVELYECAEPTQPPATTKQTTQPPVTTKQTTQPPVTTKRTTAPPTTSVPTCLEGYQLAQDNKTCIDVNECTENPGVCDQNCHNNNGSYTCSCNNGYTLQPDKKSCKDVNECTENPGVCDQNCHNNNGSYTCSCNNGYTLQPDKKSCKDNNECAVNQGGCNQVCKNVPGSFSCECINDGYRLGNDQKTCEDIDECAENTDSCNKATTTCKNNNGSYSCPCLSGYERQNAFRCKDIDECTRQTDECDEFSTLCFNEVGSYKCNCRSGYEAHTKFQCKDIDECKNDNDGCSHYCLNLNGTAICTCPSGYKTDSETEKICKDTNECLLSNGGCVHICTNTNGSYVCSCNDGYKLQSNKLTCEDIDECADGSDQCDSNSTTCKNNVGGYECPCNDGYLPIANEKHKCKAKTCPKLVESAGTNVSPKTCLQDQASVVDDECTFSCQAGYKLPSDKNTLKCLSSASWNDSIISCERVSCPSLNPPSNGRIIPDTCKTVGNLFQESCYYSCDGGYTISGVSQKQCLSSGQWDSQDEPTCQQVFPNPWITCPDSAIVDLSPGANTADVSALLESPQSNQPAERIKITPERYNNNKTFPAGDTILTYTATNPNGVTAQCRITIYVNDKEEPIVSNCSMGVFVTTTQNTEAVTWVPPTFTDNVGVTSVSATNNPGDTFYQGTTNVKYTAKDAENNQAVCEFQVVVKKLQCDTPPHPEYGWLECNEFGGSKFCQLNCTANKKMFKKGLFFSCTDPLTGFGEIPDCVDYKSPESDGSCSTGYVKQEAIDWATPDNICVKCQKGMYYDVDTKTCKNCAIGFVSREEGSLQCEACPANSSTLEEGSKKCIAQCFAGHFSNSGFDIPASLSPCQPCPKSSFQSQLGQKTCEQCPNGTTTISPGSSSSQACGGAPMISQFGPNPTNATENQQTQFECYGYGLPLPTFTIKKTIPVAEGFGGPVRQEYIVNKDGNQAGLRYIITKVMEHDEGSFECKVENAFGSDTKYIKVNVALDFSIGKRRRRRRRRRSIQA